MMVFNNFNSSFNRYYNPPRPSVTTQNYQESIKYADDMKYGGNGDGKVSATELTSIKKYLIMLQTITEICMKPLVMLNI